MQDDLGPGLLIASPQMRDPNFQGTVVLVCHHDPEGSLGVILNRPTDLKLGEVLAQLDVDAGDVAGDDVLWGGPVEQGAGFVVFPGGVGSEAGWQLVNGLAVSHSREQLERLVLSGRRDWLLCLGYSGWGPGQLVREMVDGSWLYLSPTDFDGNLLFQDAVEDRYVLALKKLGLAPEQVWMTPIQD